MQAFIQFMGDHPWLFLATGVVFILIMVVEVLRAKRNLFNVQPTRAVQLINRDHAVIIDIRPQDAFRQAHIIDAVSIPAENLQKNPKGLEKYKSKPIILVCQLGQQSQKIAAQLLKERYTVYSLAGGMRAWHDNQLPIVKNER